MEKVYLVYYANGEGWDDYYVNVDVVFASKENADKYVEEKNALIQTYTPSVTKETYLSENWYEQNGYTYEQYIEVEMDDWSRSREARYYVIEQNVQREQSYLDFKNKVELNSLKTWKKIAITILKSIK